jgi:hypothetical protein
MRRNREDKLDLADIGGETGAATHASTIAWPGRGPKRLDRVIPVVGSWLWNKKGTVKCQATHAKYSPWPSGAFLYESGSPCRLMVLADAIRR